MKKSSIPPLGKLSGPPNAEDSGPTVTREMAFYCFDVVISELNHLPPPQTNFTNAKYPLFVTWKTMPALTLRGCVGTFNALPIREGIREYAISSARDSRFTPIKLDEIKQLQVTVSLLTHFENATNFLDWTIGQHGIQIELKEGHSRYTATFLPEVAEEQGWNQIDTIDALLRKAGFQGNIGPELRNQIKLKRYQSEKISATYEEYQRIRRGEVEAVVKL